MSSKSKSGLSETPNSKVTPATPRISKVSRGVTKSESDTPSPLPKPRVSIERSPRTVTSKPTADRRSPKVSDSAEVTSKPTVDRRSPKVSDSVEVTSKPTVDRRSPKVADAAEVTSKPTVDRRSPKVADSAEKPASRLVKVSDLQVQLNLAQEELKIAKEQIASIEKDKAKAIDELNEAQKSADGANERLRDALVAQKRAEENSEIEKFRAIELEQSGIEAVQKKEEEWMKENEAVRNQHALDVAALLTTTQELQKLQQDLAMALDAKQQALTHADDATNIAEIHAEKVRALNEELARLKKMLDSKLQIEVSETNKMILDLREEVETLQLQLEKAKAFEEKVIEREAAIEQLNVELEAAKMAESYACSLVEEWKNRVEELEVHVKEANKQERSASESLNSVLQQLEQQTDLLQDAKSEAAALNEKVGMLEMTVATQKSNLHDSEQKFRVIEEENTELDRTIESLKVELEDTKEEKTSALNREKAAASSLHSLSEEKNKLMNDLKTAKEEEEKRQKAMESLASALHEASAEARESKEKLLYLQIEHETCETQLEDLQLVLKATNKKYETMLSDARHEIDLLSDELEQSKAENEKSEAEWEHKEHELMDCVKQSEAENSALQKENDRLVNLLRHAEKEAQAAMVEESLQRDTVKKVEADVALLQECLGEAKAESMKLKETLLDKENELQSVAQENEEIRAKEAAALKKIEDLSKLLEESKAQTHQTVVENGDLTDSEKEYDLLPKVVEFSDENGHGGEDEDKIIVEMLPPAHEDDSKKDESPEEESTIVFYDEAAQIAMAKMENGKTEEDEGNKHKEYDSVEEEYKMWESCKIEKKEFSPEQESAEEEVESKADSVDQVSGGNPPIAESVEDGGNSPSKQQSSSQKKKKPLLRKFGSLLKKKGSSTVKS